MKLHRLEINRELCRRCGTCLDVCPQHAIETQPDRTVVILQERCDQCGTCQASCKLRAIVKRRGLFL